VTTVVQTYIYFYTIAFGVVMGMGAVFDGTVWVNMYGRLNQGSIRGFVATALVAGTSIGPLVFGVSYDYLDSYNPSIWLAIGLAATALILALMVKKPVREVAMA
jgi:nitrate/nitrite transporter NarK